ncbi:MAG: hypothetical protein ACLUAX_14110, partial [Faecalibacterium prausnitzii]
MSHPHYSRVHLFGDKFQMHPCWFSIYFFQSLSDGFVMAPHRRSSPQAVLKDKSPSFSFSA